MSSKQYNLVNDKLPTVFFFSKSYLNDETEGSQCKNEITDSINPYVIQKNINDTYNDNSGNLVELDNNNDNITPYMDKITNTEGNPNNNYNNFIFNYITKNNNDFNKQTINDKKYKDLDNSVKKQLEYLTCRNLNDNYKLYQDKDLNSITGLLSFEGDTDSKYDIYNPMTWIYAKPIQICYNITLVLYCLILLGYTITHIIKNKNIFNINYFSLAKVVKDNNTKYIKFIIMCIIIFFILIAVFLIIYLSTHKIFIYDKNNQNNNLDNQGTATITPVLGNINITDKDGVKNKIIKIVNNLSIINKEQSKNDIITIIGNLNVNDN